MAAPAFQTKTDLAGNFYATSTTIAVPTGVAANDVLVFVAYHETATGPAITGFTNKTTYTASSHYITVLWKRATGADSGTYTITLPGTSSWVTAACLRVSGCITSGDPWDFTPVTATASSGTASAAVTGTTVTADTLLVYAGTNLSGGAWTAPSGMTERSDTSDNLTTDTLAQAVAGSTGSKSATCANNGPNASWLSALKSTSTGTSAPAESASVTVAANAATVTLAATAEGPSVTVTAYDATVSTSNSVSATAESASVTVTANAAAATVAPSAGAPAVTVTANDATVAASTTAQSASVSVTAYDATISHDLPLPDVDPDFPWVFRAAPGFQATDDPASIVWVDISDRILDGWNLRVGRTRPGEQAPARQLSFSVNNDDGLLTPTLVTSDFWPYVKLGLPFDAWRCDSSGVPVQRATVALDSIKLHWPDGLDGHCVADIVASGPLRWQGQGQQVAATAQTTTTLAAAPLALWPCTDGPSATSAASALSGGSPMTPSNAAVVFGQVTGPDGTTMYPTISGGGRLSGTVPTTLVTDRWSVRGSAKTDAATLPDTVNVLTWTTTSPSAPSWRIQWGAPTGPMTLQWLSSDGTATTVITAATPSPVGGWKQVAAYCVQNAGNVDCTLYLGGVSVGTGTATSVTTGIITTIAAGDWDGTPGYGLESVGDVAVWASAIDAAASYSGQTGYDGEMAHIRFLRLCSEAGIPATSDATTSMPMGPQKSEARTAALRACEDSDGGIMLDRADSGLEYVASSQMYNQTPALELDARTRLDLQLPFSAGLDDSTAATDVTITREGGSSRRVVVEADRQYADSDTLSLYTDDLAGAVASWRAHHGALSDLRYDGIVWDTEAVTSLLDDTLAMRPGHLIEVTGLPTPHPADAARLILQGWTETHSTAVMRITALASPARLYEVATVGSDNPADWDDTTARLDSDSSTIGGTGGTTSSTSLVVASTYGWSRTAVPYDWDVLGERVRVTAMSAYSAGRQTATVVRAINGISKTIPVDTPVSLWRPPVIGL
jgi:hypothetical protein